MLKSPLDQIRLEYRPPLPRLLSELLKISFDTESSVKTLPEIADFFPHVTQNQVLKGVLDKTCPSSPLRVGVVFSGGQAAGGHNVVIALFEALKKIHPKSLLFGFLGGPSGIIKGEAKELSQGEIDGYRNLGGFDLLGSGRTKIETEEQLKSSLDVVRNLKLDGLVVIGGDDSNTNSAVLADYFLKHRSSLKVIGVPKTIDGDLTNDHVAISFGFDTATKTYSELIGNLARDGLSDKKYTHFIKLMGRSASHIALECALKTHPNLVLIGEERRSLEEIVEEIADLVMKRASLGKNYGVILIPEGLIEFVPQLKNLPEKIEKQLLSAKDSHGNLNVSAIETEALLIQMTQDELQRRNFSGKFSPVSHFFGYEGRSALPSNFDATYCQALGYVAALLIHKGYTGYMCAVGSLTKPATEWTIGAVPLTSLMHFEMRKGVKKPVIAKTLVNLKGKPYLAYQKEKEAWKLGNSSIFPGPIQFFGPSHITDTTPLIIRGLK